MIRQLWTFEKYEDCDYSFDELSCLKNFIGSPPPPYSAEDLLRNEQSQKKTPVHEKDRKLSYCDVGQEIYITIHKKPNEELGITLLNGDSFDPKWPTVLDIRADSPAARSVNTLEIGDQIKELFGIPTHTLTHSQILALFSKASDQVNLVVRRGVEPSDRSFKWYKHPFSSVKHTFEEIAIDKKDFYEVNRDLDEDLHDAHTLLFQSFKTDDNHLNKKHENQFSKIAIGIRHTRSLSASATCKRNFLTQTPRQRRRTLDHTGRFAPDLFFPITHKKGVRYIADEIEKLSISENLLADSRSDSQSSLNSSLSSSSFSNTSSGTTHEQCCVSRPRWMSQTLPNPSISEHTQKNCCFENDQLTNSSFKTPVNIIRNSFRKRKTKKDLSTEKDDNFEKSSQFPNTLLLTVWIADRKKLGLKLEGGNVSPYGDSNIFVQEVKKMGSGEKIFQVGDEILEIDGQPMNNVNVNEANRLISKLEGNYVEFKIFRPIQ